MSNSRPLLSICIPTFNRAVLLRSALWSLASQVCHAGNLVEVIVSDNASTDETEQVVRWAQQFMPIRYHRNNENIGAIANFFILTNHLAQGDFGWLLGDDDLVREDAVESIVHAIQEHPTIDYIFVNHSYEDVSSRNNHGELITGADFPELRNLLCFESSNQQVEHWEKIISFTRVPALFTSIVSSVFRLEKWKAISTKLGLTGGELFSSLETTFPHACIIARMLVGKPAVYLGYPHVILFTGTQQWFARWPETLFVRVLELSDLLQSLGVARALVDYYRDTIFNSSSEQLRLLLTQPLANSLPVVWRLVSRYGKYLTMWRMFSRTLGLRRSN